MDCILFCVYALGVAELFVSGVCWGMMTLFPTLAERVYGNDTLHTDEKTESPISSHRLAYYIAICVLMALIVVKWGNMEEWYARAALGGYLISILEPLAIKGMKGCFQNHN